MKFNFVPMNEIHSKKMLESEDWKYDGEVYGKDTEVLYMKRELKNRL